MKRKESAIKGAFFVSDDLYGEDSLSALLRIKEYDRQAVTIRVTRRVSQIDVIKTLVNYDVSHYLVKEGNFGTTYNEENVCRVIGILKKNGELTKKS
jgi:hypothetical protein